MRKKQIHRILFVTLLLVILLISMLISLVSGDLDIHLSDVIKIFNHKTGIEYTILAKIRLPRIMLAFSVGGALSLTGTVLQGIYRNPLVEPYTLGISGGAAVGIALVIVIGLPISVGAIMLPLAGFSGSLLTLFLVYSLGTRRGGININRMLLIGVMISFIASSIMMVLMSVTSADNLHSIIFWTMGSLDEPNKALINIALGSALTGLLIAHLFARPLNALRLGETKAQHLGINSTVTIRILFIVASLLTGICVAVTGIIGFVGLLIPHLMRMLIGTDYRLLLISSFMGGSIFLVISDIIARTIIAPNELPIGVITGLIGGLVFIIILRRSKSKLKFS